MGLNADRTGPIDAWLLRGPEDDEDSADDELADTLDFAEWQDQQEVRQAQAAG